MNVPMDLKAVSGTDGSVRMPDAGILVGWFSSWHMTKQGDGTYLFRGTFGHVNETLWKQDYRKTISLKLTGQKTYGLCQDEGRKIEFNAEAKTLVHEGRHLCPAQ